MEINDNIYIFACTAIRKKEWKKKRERGIKLMARFGIVEKVK